jgi:hypothetical protein
MNSTDKPTVLKQLSEGFPSAIYQECADVKQKDGWKADASEEEAAGDHKAHGHNREGDCGSGPGSGWLWVGRLCF